MEVSVFVDEFQGVSGVAVHVGVAVGGSSVAEQDHDLVDGFLVCAEIVPEHIGVFQVGLRIAFLGVNEEREFAGISQEEDWSIVHNLVSR